MAVAATHAGGKHPALKKRSVNVDFIQNLAVELTLYQSEDAMVTDPHESEALRFQFSPGDQFYVPPNNTYRLMNRSTTQPAKLFFAMLRPVCDRDDSSSSG